MPVLPSQAKAQLPSQAMGGGRPSTPPANAASAAAPANAQAARGFKKGGAVKKAKGGLMCSPRKKMAMGMKKGGSVKKYAKGGMAKKGC